jgi:hypothetical protein
VPENLYTYLWTLPDKESHWYSLAQGPATLSGQIEAMGQREDRQVYIATGTAHTAGQRYKRVKAEDIAGFMGLWADIDIGDPDVHKKWNLPPDESSARLVIERCGLEPTILVHSGHGLQAWWLFTEFWQFDNTDENAEGARLAKAWHDTLKVRAGEHHWVIDSTFDLARVMRPPGAFNRKNIDRPVLVRMLDCEGARRYNPSDFEEFLADPSILADKGITPQRSYVVDNLKLDSKADPPFDLFETISSFEPKFKASWEHKRRDLKDQTNSAYDMSLASIAAYHGFTDQNIADLLIAHRRKYGDLDKAMRADYIPRTIAAARQDMAKEESIETIEQTTSSYNDARQVGDEEKVGDLRRELINLIDNQLGLEWTGFEKLQSDPPVWQGELAGGRVVYLGTSRDLITFATFRSRIMNKTDVLIERLGRDAYDRLVQAVLTVSEPVETGLESTESGQMYLWVSDYLVSHPPMDYDERDEAAANEHPYIDNDKLILFPTAFKTWLYLQRTVRIEARELSKRLHNYGATNTKVNVMVDGQRTTRSVWKMDRPKEYA